MQINHDKSLSPSLLIKGCAAIMTGLAGSAAHHAGPDLRIRDGVIEAVGDLPAQPGERVVDARDCVLYPAWVNTHHHLFQSLFKGDRAGLDASLSAWLGSTASRFPARFDAQAFRLAVRIGMVELLRSGCATIADHNYLYYPGMSFDSSAILFEEAETLGVRLVLCRGGGIRSPGQQAQVDGLPGETLEQYLADMERLAKRWHQPGADAMRRLVMAPTTPLHSADPGQLKEMAQHARGLGIRLHSHLSETVSYQDTAREQYGCGPIEFVERCGWLGPDVWFAHLVKLEEDEIRLLGATGTGVAHCPQSNGRLGSGIAPIPAMEAAGMAISLGVDGAASNEAADMISEVHAAWLMQRARMGMAARPRYQGGEFEGGASAATIEDVVRWGTAGGARVLGFDGLGTIAPGMRADLALYALDDPRYFGLHDPGIGPVACGGRPRLKLLLAAGATLVEDDAIPGVDLMQLAHQARAAVARLTA